MKRLILIALLLVAATALGATKTFTRQFVLPQSGGSTQHGGTIKQDAATTAFPYTEEMISPDNYAVRTSLKSTASHKRLAILVLDSNNIWNNTPNDSTNGHIPSNWQLDPSYGAITVTLYIANGKDAMNLYVHPALRKFDASSGGTWTAASTGINWTDAGACDQGASGCSEDVSGAGIYTNTNSGTGKDRYDTDLANVYCEGINNPWIVTFTIDDTTWIGRTRTTSANSFALIVEMTSASASDSTDLYINTRLIDEITYRSYVTINAVRPVVAGSSSERRRRN